MNDLLADAVVHTTGVNWVSTLTIVGIIVTLMTVILGFIARWVSNQITNAINKFRIEVVNQLDTRLTKLESIAEQRRR